MITVVYDTVEHIQRIDDIKNTGIRRVSGPRQSRDVVQDHAMSLPPEEGMSGRLARALLVAFAAARVGVTARPRRHGLDALKVDQQIDRSDDGRQRRHDDESENGHRHSRRGGAGSRRRRRGVGRWRGRDKPVDNYVVVRVVVVVVVFGVRTRVGGVRGGEPRLERSVALSLRMTELIHGVCDAAAAI